MLERVGITFTANGRNDHVTMFILHLPLAVFSFLEKLSRFALPSKASQNYFALNAILNLSIIWRISSFFFPSFRWGILRHMV